MTNKESIDTSSEKNEKKLKKTTKRVWVALAGLLALSWCVTLDEVDWYYRDTRYWERSQTQWDWDINNFLPDRNSWGIVNFRRDNRERSDFTHPLVNRERMERMLWFYIERWTLQTTINRLSFDGRKPEIDSDKETIALKWYNISKVQWVSDNIEKQFILDRLCKIELYFEEDWIDFVEEILLFYDNRSWEFRIKSSATRRDHLVSWKRTFDRIIRNEWNYHIRDKIDHSVRIPTRRWTVTLYLSAK